MNQPNLTSQTARQKRRHAVIHAGKGLTWSNIISIDAISAIGLLALLCAFSLNFGTTLITKARMTGLWLSFHTQRDELIEQLAVNGDGFAGQSADAFSLPGEPGNQVARVDDIEAALSFRASPKSEKNNNVLAEGKEHVLNQLNLPTIAKEWLARPANDGEKRASDDSTNQFNAMLSDHSVLIGIAPGAGKPAHVLAITPAVISQGTPGSMVWLCGWRAPPSGWYRLPGPVGTDLPQDLLYSLCRTHRKP